MYALIIANKNYSSWSLRPWILLRTLNIPFNERRFKFGGGFDTPEFAAASPARMVPVLHDGGTVVWDSLAIVEYLAERHEGVWPENSQARAWARSAAAEMHSGFSALRNICPMNCGVRVALTSQPAPLMANLDRLRTLWAEGIDRFGGPFLAGPAFTAVDAFFAPVAFRAQSFGLDLGPVGNAYVQTLLDLSAMQEWYEAALLETPNDPAHEDEATAHGALQRDCRLAHIH